MLKDMSFLHCTQAATHSDAEPVTLVLHTLSIDQRIAAGCIVVLLLSDFHKFMRFVKTDCCRIGGINVQPQCCSACGTRRPFEPPQQLPADALPAMYGLDLDGLNVCTQAPNGWRPLDNAKTGHATHLLGNPCRRVLRVDEPMHVAPSEPERRLKALLLDRVQRIEIIRLVGTIFHVCKQRKAALARAALSFRAMSTPRCLDLRFQIANYAEAPLVKPAIGGNGFLDRDVRDLCTVQHRDPAPLALMDHIDGMKAVTLAE